jgi:hypothetical protein
MYQIARLLILLLLLGGGDPLGMLFSPTANVSSPAEDDDNVEAGKVVVQSQHVQQHRPRIARRSSPPWSARQIQKPIAGTRGDRNASTAFLATINSPLIC